MLKKLQQKFVLLTTLISIAVMFTIAFSINIANYVSMVSSSDEVLDLIVQGDLQMGKPLPEHGRFPSEIAFTTRFFVVKTNQNGEIVLIDTKNINSVTPDMAVNYVMNLTGNDIGIVDDFRYSKVENDFGYSYFFLDIEKEIISFQTYLFYSVLVFITSIILIFVLSILLSKKAVEPIASSYERQKSFITNVSHEFKTPLAIINANCEVLELSSVDDECTNSIKKQISRLNSLVENLISLTKLEEKIDLIKTDFSLTDKITDTVNEFSPNIKSNMLELVSGIEENISYNGDEKYIRNLISILTENAVKYALPNTLLNVNLNSQGNNKIFSITNACEDIEIGNHNDWFERFYRADKSRNSNVKGFGIGLSIAKAICDMNSFEIFAESKTGKEITVTVIF